MNITKERYCNRLREKISSNNSEPIYEYINIIKEIDQDSNISDNEKKKMKKIVAECLVEIIQKDSSSKPNSNNINIDSLNKLTEIILTYFNTNNPTTKQEKKIFKLMIDVIFEIVIKMNSLSKKISDFEKKKFDKLLDSFINQKHKKSSEQAREQSRRNPRLQSSQGYGSSRFGSPDYGSGWFGRYGSL